MNNIKILTIVTIICFAIATGCSNFLDEADKSNFTEENYFTKPEHARSAINSIYASMREPLTSGFGGGAWMMTEFATGLAETDLGQAVNSYYIKELNNTSDNTYGLSYWTNYYKGIGNANLSIEKIPTVVMDETEKKQILGEAHFLRAFYYFHLVRMFGNIPLITEPISLNSPQLLPKQAAPEEVYNLIVSDLKIAENAGLPWLDQTGKVSLGAIKSLLAQAYLTMAGYPLNKGIEYFTLAANKAKEVIDSKTFQLFDSYYSLHDPAKKNIEENILMIQYKTQVIPSPWQVSVIPYNKNISKYADETGGIYANKSFVESFETGDLRTQEKEFFYTTYSHESNPNQTVQLGGYFIYKLFDEAAHKTTANSDLNWSLIRYAEVLLTYAEAQNEVAGPSTDVYNAVNDIRKRAKLKELKNLNQATLREAIWKERWHELCYENKTWYDMVRLRKALNIKTQQFEKYIGHKFPNGATVTERELLFPIPTAEVRNNKNLKQNEGY
ncbi:RagB/SusD family nutrient uptake outer membrane protein [Sphingobacterium sp. UT-1RO-CII-1]|uniref:RagB/SusD family nutrient uptake outer membrane protein n=1 Tax=Sphingobacterium sp. UT-1RO-CII-1 TaxID=2995225 RepID=UPI00227B6646|nr:RagB/SusD family nutrient uptake outer membrane protein [Sphingobacterium sp. UT-1RO-CII-1]MCY4779742.1 RagB/SusD family nutrient uptake outer membrane protein [Sphingobacterium sp. UT-1RO-CII-1]